MAGSSTSERLSEHAESVRRLIEQHRELEDEPLHLVVRYLPAPPRDGRHVYLLEVIGSQWEPNEERDSFEVTYAGTEGFPMRVDERLHLILTNPQELKVALSAGWPLVAKWSRLFGSPIMKCCTRTRWERWH